jgi:hypothetical protein
MNNLEKVKFMLRKKKLQKPKKIKKSKLPKTFYCETCDKHYTRENKYYHYESNFHKNNLDNNK